MAKQLKLKPTLSLCIPTYNRKIFLKQCLDSIYSQTDSKLMKDIQVIICDDSSTDDTTELAKKYLAKYPNMEYHRNPKNVGMIENLLKVATYAKGDYVWFCSDDDILRKKSLIKVLSVISDNQPSAIIVNNDQFNGTPDDIVITNTLNLNKDICITSAKDLMSFFETKLLHFNTWGEFFRQHVSFPIDWITTHYTATVIKKSIFDKNYPKFIRSRFKTSFFPHSGLIFYYLDDYKIYFISDRLVLYRLNNLSWNLSDKVKFAERWDMELQKHYSWMMSTYRRFYSGKLKVYFSIRSLIRFLRIKMMKQSKNHLASA